MTFLRASSLALLFFVPAALVAQVAVRPGPGVALIPPKPFPRTLIAGTFRIEVEEYDRPSRSADSTRPSGIGRVRFICTPVIPPFPWRDLRPSLKTFAVVETITDSLREIHLADAMLIDPDVRAGGTVQLTLPERPVSTQTLADMHELLEIIHGSHGPHGIRVRFRDVKWNGPAAPTVILTEGSATYPTIPAVPAVPALVTISPGFSLGIDSLIITPGRSRVKGSVFLPSCLVSATRCTRSALPLPWTPINGLCEVYREVPDSLYGPLFVGETGFQVLGRGYTIDFSGSLSDPAVVPALANGWKGVVLRSGESPDPPSEPVISNRGYVDAKYTFPYGLVTASGLAARLTLSAAFSFETIEPLGYEVVIRPPSGSVELGSCGVVGGSFFAGEIRVPRIAIRDEAGQRVSATYDTLTVQGDMDLFGAVKIAGGFTWGEFFKTTSTPKYFQLGADVISGQPASGYFYLAARQRPPYYPTGSGTFQRPVVDHPDPDLESQGVQGITLTKLGHRKFTIWTQDVPGGGTILQPRKLEFPDSSIFMNWLNIVGTGIHTEVVVAKYIGQKDRVNLGPTWSTNPRYQGETPLRVSFKSDPLAKQRQMRMRFVESATWDSNFDGRIFLAGPMNDTTRFSNLIFTSTADAGGAQLDLTHSLEMKYWGVTLVPEDSALAAGGGVREAQGHLHHCRWDLRTAAFRASVLADLGRDQGVREPGAVVV